MWVRVLREKEGNALRWVGIEGNVGWLEAFHKRGSQWMEL